MTKDPRVYLAHILERADRSQAYVRDGEAAERVPLECRAAHPSIPWQLMAGFRDVLIHGHEGVDIARVWVTAARDLPTVRAAILAILPPLDQLERELAGDLDEGDQR